MAWWMTTLGCPVVVRLVMGTKGREVEAPVWPFVRCGDGYGQELEGSSRKCGTEGWSGGWGTRSVVGQTEVLGEGLK